MGCSGPDRSALASAGLLTALLLGGAGLAMLQGAAAQGPAGAGLRGADPAAGALPAAASTPDSRAPLPTLARPADPAASQSRRARLRVRRSRPPTVAPVRAIVRPPIVNPRVVPEIQPPLVGLPDTPLQALAVRRRRPAADDPYGPLGLRVGNVNLYPAIEQSLGYDTNPNRANKGLARGSFVSRSDAELRLQSDWSAHELTGFLRGGYSAFERVPEADRPDGEGQVGLRIDASRDTALDAEGHFRIDTVRPGSPELNARVVERPIFATEGGSAGVSQRFNRLQIGLRGGVDRLDYEDARLTSGTVLDQSDRNQTRTALRLRAGYELKPGMVPFLEGYVDRRDYDRRVDSAGFRRSSDGIGVKLGTSVELTRLVTGEVSAGVEERHYEDRRLGTLRGPIVDAAIIWQATPLTQVRLRGSRRLEETTIPSANGVVTDQAILEVQHDLRRNLSLVAAFTFFHNDYQGVRLREDGYAATARVEYRLNRHVALRASYTHERLDTSVLGGDYTADVFLVGLRFQR